MLKKVLKILAIIIGLIILVFLLAGLFVPKVEYQVSVDIDKPLQETWEKFNDRNQMQNWIPEVKSIKSLKETPEIVGSQYEMEVENQGNSVIMIETVKEYVVAEKVALHYDIGNMIKDDSYVFIGQNGSTTITSDHTCRGSNYIHRCMFAFFKSMFKKIDQGYMDRFKAWIESS